MLVFFFLIFNFFFFFFFFFFSNFVVFKVWGRIFPKKIAKFTPKKTKKFPIVLPQQDENPPKFKKKVKV